MTNPRVVYSSKASASSECEIVISNQNRITILKEEMPFDGDWKVLISNCRDATIYIGATVHSVTVTNCKECEIVIMMVKDFVNLTSSDSVTLRCVARSLSVDSSASCSIYAYTQGAIQFDGHSRDMTIAPFNTLWSKHSEQIETVDWINDITTSMWMKDVDPKKCSVLDVSQYRLTFFPEFSNASSFVLAVPIPEAYEEGIRNKNALMEVLRRRLLATCSDTNLHKVNAILAGHFREWLTSSRKVRFMTDIVKQYNH